MRTDRVPARMITNGNLTKIPSNSRGGQLSLVPSWGDVRRVVLPACVWLRLGQVKGCIRSKGQAGKAWGMDRLTAGRTMAVPSFRFAPLGNSRQSISRPGTTTGLRASSAKAVLMAVTGPVTVSGQASPGCPVACIEVAQLNGWAGICRYLFPCGRTARDSTTAADESP